MDFPIDAEREVDYVLLNQLRALAAKIETENERLRRENQVKEGEANDGR